MQNNKLILAYIYDCLIKSEKITGSYLRCDQEYINDYNFRGEKRFFHSIIPKNGIYTLDNIQIDIH